MSIIAAADPSQPSLLIQVAILAAILLPGLVVVWWTRSYRRSSVIGPLRVPDDAPVWPVPVAVAIGFFGWIGSATVYATAVMMKSAGAPASQPASAPATPMSAEAAMMAMMSPGDFIILAAGTPLVGLLCGVAFLMLVKRPALAWLGFTLSHLPRGVALGALAAVFGVPFTFLASAITELIYQAVQFQHPAEHELLKFMKDAPELWVQVAAIAAAVIIAPLVEEFLFRGLVQTSLMTWFHRFGQARTTPPPLQWLPGLQGFPMMPPPPSDGVGIPGAMSTATPAESTVSMSEHNPVAQPPSWTTPPSLPYMLPDTPIPPITPEPLIRRRAWPSWLAIVITSVLFAVIHPLWTAPIIFVLSLILGYVYERTGNLWAAVALHAIFNTSSTALYLSGIGQS